MSEPGGNANWRTRATTLSKKVPTKWVVTGFLALFLAGSAAFGGLETVAADDLPQVAAGAAYDGDQLHITVSRAVLIDGFPDQGINPEDGKRFFVVIATVENVWDRPVSTYPNTGAADNLRPVGVEGIGADTDPDRVLIISDGTASPRLQPRVPVELAFLWEVDKSITGKLGDVQIDIYDKVYAADGFVTYGARYDQPYVAAFTQVPVEDVGAGAEAQADAGPDAESDAGSDAAATGEPAS